MSTSDERTNPERWDAGVKALYQIGEAAATAAEFIERFVEIFTTDKKENN